MEATLPDLQLPPAATTKAPVRLIAVDMDGTLLNADAEVSPRTLAAIAAAERAGIHFVIATGRRHSYAMRVLRPLNLTPDNVLITANGASVRTISSRLIESTHLPLPTCRWFLQHMNEFRNSIVATFDRVGPDGDDTRGALVVESFEDLHNSIDRWMRLNEPYIAHVHPMELALEADAPLQFMVVGTIEHMRRAEARLLEHPNVSPIGQTPQNPNALLQLSRTEYPLRDLSLLDILPAGVSKGAALLRFAATHGVAPDEIMAIGDNWNDVSMFDVVGHPVLMGNAPEDLFPVAKARNWRLAPAHVQDGVAQTIESVLETAHHA